MLSMQLIAVATMIQAISEILVAALSLYSLQDSKLDLPQVFKTVAHWAWMKLKCFQPCQRPNTVQVQYGIVCPSPIRSHRRQTVAPKTDVHWFIWVSYLDTVSRAGAVFMVKKIC